MSNTHQRYFAPCAIMELASVSDSCGLHDIPWVLRRCIMSFLPAADVMTVSSIRPLGISVSNIAPQRFLTAASFEKHIDVDNGQSLFVMPIPIYVPVSITHSVSIKFSWRYIFYYSTIPKLSIVAISKDETLPQATQASAFQGGRTICESVWTSAWEKTQVMSFGLREDETCYLCFCGKERFPDLPHCLEDFFVTTHIYDDRQQTLSRIYRQLRTLGIAQMENEYGASCDVLLADCESLTRQLCDRDARRGAVRDRQLTQFLREFNIPVVPASLRAVRDCILSEKEVNRSYEDIVRGGRQEAGTEEIPTSTLPSRHAQLPQQHAVAHRRSHRRCRREPSRRERLHHRQLELLRESRECVDACMPN
jgi:hypothetical protein